MTEIFDWESELKLAMEQIALGMSSLPWKLDCALEAVERFRGVIPPEDEPSASSRTDPEAFSSMAVLTNNPPADP